MWSEEVSSADSATLLYAQFSLPVKKALLRNMSAVGEIMPCVGVYVCKLDVWAALFNGMQLSS